MNKNLKALLLKSPVILDGAWGTQLLNSGLQPGECPDHWNLTNKEKIKKLAEEYVEAGSQIILTNTFRANRITLRSYNLESKFREINKCGVKIAREAADNSTFVFGSIGPISRILTDANISENHMYDIFFEQASVLADEGADAIVLESMTGLNEASIALRASKSTGLSVVVSMVFNSGENKDRTIAGNTPEQVAIELTRGGADIIGANCGYGIEGYLQICRRLHAATSKSIWIKPSAGGAEVVNGKIFYKTTSRNFAMYAAVLSQLGARFIGGCCGTTPEYIRDLNRALKKSTKL